MRYTVLTNFDNYTSNISCNSKGIITLTLTPNRINEICTRTNIITKKIETSFDSKVCTSYKKNDKEYLFKFTNYKPSEETSQFKTYKVLKISEFKIPCDKDIEFINSRRNYIFSNYRYKKLKKLESKYNSYKERII